MSRGEWCKSCYCTETERCWQCGMLHRASRCADPYWCVVYAMCAMLTNEEHKALDERRYERRLWTLGLFAVAGMRTPLGDAVVGVWREWHRPQRGFHV